MGDLRHAAGRRAMKNQKSDVGCRIDIVRERNKKNGIARAMPRFAAA